MPKKKNLDKTKDYRANDKFISNHQKIEPTKEKHTTVGIRWWSPTQLLVYRSEACVWQSGRDAQFSSVYGRMYHGFQALNTYIALPSSFLVVEMMLDL